MKNVSKMALATLVALQSHVALAIDADATRETTTGDNNKSGSIISTLDVLLGYFIGLLYFIAVLYALWGGFNILTAGGDEEKVKKGKTTLIQAVIGLVVIFLSSQIITWAMSLGGKAVTATS